MSAGTGVLHSEYSSPTEETHLLQIWILPEQKNLRPSYEQKFFPPEEKRGKLKLVASRAGADGSVTIHQDVNLYASILADGETVSHEIKENRHAWVQVIKGEIDLSGEILKQGDGAAISDENLLKIKSLADESEFLLFDLG
jgi:redox-sensitive bicupin YhaK (pirin superfamily)